MSRLNRQKAFRLGLSAETWAAWWLRLKGFRILERRYRTPVGEIDLIARRGRLIIFVEVKARASHEKALESITARQRARIESAASIYLSNRPNSNGRFDVVTVAAKGGPRHWVNVWATD